MLALSDNSVEIVNEFLVALLFDWRYSTVVVKWKINLFHLTEHIHDELETGLLQGFLSLRIKIID